MSMLSTSMKRLSVAIAALAVLALAACDPNPANNNPDAGNNNNNNNNDAGDGCDPDDEKRGVTVVLTSSAGGARICNATIVASEGAFSEELLVFGDATDCEYFGLFDRAGSYVLTITAPDFNGATESASVSVDSCGHAITQSLSFTLTPGDDPPPPPPDGGPDPVDGGPGPVDGGDPVVDAGPGPVQDAGPGPVDAGNNPGQDAGGDAG